MSRTINGLGLLVLALAATVPSGAAQASGAAGTTRIVPAAAATTEARASTIAPFDCGYNNFSPSMRYQQAYGGKQVGAGTIDRIAFRRDTGFGGRTAAPLTLHHVTITLSTSTRGYDRLDPMFANNVGRDVVTVYQGDVTFSGRNVSMPNPFDDRIALQQSFSFTGAGSLLLDVTVPTCAAGDLDHVLDAATSKPGGDTVSSVFGRAGASSGKADSGGLVTQFHRI